MLQPIDRRLVSMAAVLDEVGLATATPALERILEAACADAQRYCQRTFARRAVVENVISRGQVLLVSLRPIVSVTSITTRSGGTVDVADVDVDADGGVIRLRSGNIDTARQRADFTEGTRAAGTETRDVTVSYTGGYITSAQVEAKQAVDADRDMPADLEDAILRLVRHRWYARQRDPGIASEALGRYSVTYRGQGDAAPVGERGAGLPADVVGVLDGYAAVIHG